MNKEDYVSFEVVKLLKEKGYDEDCNILVVEEYCSFNKGKLTCVDKDREFCPFPTLYEAAKWLRNKYDINVAVNAVIPMWFDRGPKDSDTLYMPSITHKNVDGKIEMLMLRNLNDFNYEKAYNNGILEALKLI